MLNRAILFMLAGILFACTFGLCAEAPAAPNTEVRGMWVTAWDSSLLTPAEIDETIELARKANINFLVIQVRKAGDAHYKSAYEPRGENIPDPKFDPLAHIIKRAHASGIEVHAWLNTYKVWQGTRRPKSPNHVFNKHPEWINKTNEGRLDKSGSYGLDPGIKDVQEYTYKIFMDVVKNYDVDGVHFDYVRYWDPWFGYSNLAVERYKKETGAKETPFYNDPQWCQWRRDRVTDLVRQVYEGVKAVKPWVKVTGAVVCSQALTEQFKDSHPYNMLLQEWERWTREGIIDAVIPMNYKTSEADAQLFKDWTGAIAKWSHDRHAYNGISVRTPELYEAQVKISREQGTDGVVGFAFNGRSRSLIVNALRDGVYREWVPVAPMPWKAPRKSGGPITDTDPKVLYDKAIAFAAGNDLDTAIILLKRAVEKDINFTDAYFRLGRCYLRTGMKAEAAEKFRQTLEIEPEHKEAQAELRKLAG